MPRPTREQTIAASLAVALAALAAVMLASLSGMPWIQAAGLPLFLLGLLIVVWNTHWALCFIAFAIGPLGVVQQEVMGVTLNLPEVLILALTAKEGARLLRQREWIPPALPARTLAVFILASAAALATGIAHQNGAVRVLQDCRQFTEFLVLFWLVLKCVAGRDEALRIAGCYAVGATLLAIHGIVQQVVPVGISATQISSDLVLHHGIRSGSFYGATTLGGIMVLGVAPAAGVALSSRRRTIQVLMGLCILLCLIAIVFTRTRGSWLGLSVALVLIGLSVRPSGKTLAAVACAGMGLLLVLGPLVVQRLYTLADPEQDISLMARAQYYAAAARIGEAHPVLGLGWGCYYDIDAILQAGRYVETPFIEAVEETPSSTPDPAPEATVHSAYLQLFVKTGLLGLGAFLAIIVVWLERIWRGRNTRFQTDPTHALYVGISAGLAGYLFHSTFENFFQWPVMAQSFWLLFGLSFVLAPKAEARGPRYRIPLAFVSGSVAVFLVFMVACMRLETLHTDHYERNVAKALEEGNLEKALHIARRATEVNLYEPMPFTVYARLLLMQGDVPAAFAALETSVGTTERPPAPRSRYTGPRYYFAPARLTLGKYYAERGAWDRALQQFELARSYDDLARDAYADFHAVLYTVYSTRGRWARALAFGRPDSAALAEMPLYTLLKIARAATGMGDWPFAHHLTALLRERGGYLAEANCLEGRAYLAEKNVERAIAALTSARDFPEVPWFLGTALARAGRSKEALAAFLAAPETSPYYPLALAKAWTILNAAGNTDQSAAVLAQFGEALSRLSRAPAAEEASSTPALLAFGVPSSGAEADGPMPAVFLWGEATGVAPAALSVVEHGDDVLVYLDGTGQVLQLRAVENRVAWAGVERAYPTDDVLPGWIDAARDWFDLRDSAGAVVADGGGENPALLLNRTAWILSTPARVPAGAVCLLTGRFRDADGQGRFGWQSLSDANLVLREGALADREPLKDWVARSAILPPDPDREAVRVLFESATPAGGVFADDILLIDLNPPPASP